MNPSGFYVDPMVRYIWLSFQVRWR